MAFAGILHGSSVPPMIFPGSSSNSTAISLAKRLSLVAISAVLLIAPFPTSQGQEVNPDDEATVDDTWSPFGLITRPFGTEGLLYRSGDDTHTFAEKIWSLPVLYENPEGRFIQKIRLLGR